MTKPMNFPGRVRLRRVAALGRLRAKSELPSDARTALMVRLGELIASTAGAREIKTKKWRGPGWRGKIGR